MEHIDLFSGIGGFALAASRVWPNHEIVTFCEKDQYCRKILKKHWPDTPICEDIYELKGQPCDLITGGFPCQPFSTAGKQRGTDDDRYLWPEMLRIIREAKPTWVVGENVAGIVNMALDQVLIDLEMEGYACQCFIIPACGVNAPHRRNRVWIVAHSESERTVRRSEEIYKEDGRQRRTLPRESEQSSQAASDVGHASRTASQRDTRGLFETQEGVSSEGQQDGDMRVGPEHASQDVADASELHSNGGDYQPRCQEPQPRDSSCQNRRDWPTEPDVGRTLDEFSSWLDGCGLTKETHKCIMAHVDKYGDQYAKNKSQRPCEILRTLWDGIYSEEVRRQVGGQVSLSAEKVLLAYLCKLQATSKTLEYVSLPGEETQKDLLRKLWNGEKSPGASCRPGHKEQQEREHSDSLQALSRLLAHDSEKAWSGYRRENAADIMHHWRPGWEDGIARVATNIPKRVDRLRALGNAIVPQVAEQIFRIIKSCATGLRE